MVGEAVRKDIVEMNKSLKKLKTSNTRHSSGTSTPTRGRKTRSPTASLKSRKSASEHKDSGGATRGRKKKAYATDKVDYHSEFSDTMSYSSKASGSSYRGSISASSKRI